MVYTKRRLLVHFLIGAVCVHILVYGIMTKKGNTVRSEISNVIASEADEFLWNNNNNTVTNKATSSSTISATTTTTRKTTTTEHELCKWNHSLSRPDKRASDLAKDPSLLYNINLDKEIKAAILGSPIQFLDNYRNPCWRSTLPAVSTYRSNPILRTKDSSVTAAEEALSELRANKASSRLRCLPLVYVVGTAKGGTTDLFSILSRHPDVETPEIKDMFYWNSKRLTGVSFSQYVEVYDTAAKRIEDGDEANTRCHHKITVDVTVDALDLFSWHRMPSHKRLNSPRFFASDTIRHVVPGARIIVSLRKPTDRIYSYFRMRCPNCDVDDFHSLVSSALSTLKDCERQHTLTTCLLNNRWAKLSETMAMHLKSSFYVVFLENWLKSFPRGQVLVVRSEDYFKNRTQVVVEMSHFLKIDVPNNEILGQMARQNVYNSGLKSLHTSSDPMMSRTRKLLDDLYRPYNEKLAKLLNDDKFLWKDT